MIAAASVNSANKVHALFAVQNQAAARLTVVNRNSHEVPSVVFSVAIVPAGESLSDAHWIAYKEFAFPSMRFVSEVLMLGKGERVMIRASHTNVNFILNGMAS